MTNEKLLAHLDAAVIHLARVVAELRGHATSGKPTRRPYVHSAAFAERKMQMRERIIAEIPVRKIAAEFGVSDQAIRQFAKRHGLSMHRRPKVKTVNAIAARKEASDARCMKKWGVDFKATKELRALGILQEFGSQRNTCHSRGIPWELTFAEWYEFWLSSGFFHQRGRGKGQYVMARRDRNKPYAVGNIKIVLGADNIREIRALTRGNVSPITGVYCLYPGLAKPWVARINRKHLGNFETAETASAAREQALQAA